VNLEQLESKLRDLETLYYQIASGIELAREEFQMLNSRPQWFSSEKDYPFEGIPGPDGKWRFRVGSWTRNNTTVTLASNVGGEFYELTPGTNDYIYLLLDSPTAPTAVTLTSAAAVPAGAWVVGKFANGIWTQLWHGGNITDPSAEDKLVAVAAGTTPGYLGAVYNQGVLRTGSGVGEGPAGVPPMLLVNMITKTDGGNFITATHANTSEQASVANTGTTVIQSVGLDDAGHVTSLASKSLSIYLIDGDHTGDLLQWTGATWALIHPPSTPSVLAWDSDGGVHWVGIDTAYKVVQRNAANQVVGDWPRVNTATP
jgi:hypothetical protein